MFSHSSRLNFSALWFAHILRFGCGPACQKCVTKVSALVAQRRQPWSFTPHYCALHS